MESDWCRWTGNCDGDLFRSNPRSPGAIERGETDEGISDSVLVRPFLRGLHGGECIGRSGRARKEWGASAMVRQGRRPLALEAPPKGFITNAKDFAILWRVSRMAGAIPPVDFDKYLILVVTTRSSVLQVRAVR